jgi:hypothetical protein
MYEAEGINWLCVTSSVATKNKPCNSLIVVHIHPSIMINTKDRIKCLLTALLRAARYIFGIQPGGIITSRSNLGG